MNIINKLLLDIKDGKKQGKRLGLCFSTSSNHYYYDSGTGKIFKCGETEKMILDSIISENVDDLLSNNSDKIQECLETINNLIINEDILNMPQYTEFSWGISEIKNEKIDKVIFELTQSCNLRCHYCLYNEDFHGFRTYENKRMSWETAKKGLDFIYQITKDLVKISFYGGEPLLEFDLMKNCIDYCEKNFVDKEIYYSFTTNLTLLDDMKINYFAGLKNINILCSLDGPQILHDRNRVDLKGRGSFELAIKNLRELVKKFNKKAGECIAINVVLNPPFTYNQFELVKNFFNSLSWLPRECKIYCAYVNTGEIGERVKTTNELIEYDILKAWAVSNICSSSSKDDVSFEINLEKPSIANVYMRSLSNKAKKKLQRNGCCIPGFSRLYITSDGDFKICEKMGDSPIFGNVYDGIDFNVLEDKYIKEYDDVILDKCNNCWACHMCSSCYSSCYNEDGIDRINKNKLCDLIRSDIKNQLIEFYEIVEKRPDYIREILSVFEMK